MNILLLSNKMPFPLKDGGAIAIYKVAEGLSQFQNEITILAINTQKHFVDSTFAKKEIKNIAILYDIVLNTRINILQAFHNLLFSKLPYNAVRFWSKKYKHMLIKLLNEQSFDIIQIESIYLSMYIPIIRKITTSRIVLRTHNIEHEIWESLAKNTKSMLKKKYFSHLSKRIKMFEANSIPKYDLFVPLSVNDAEKLQKMGANKPIKIIPTGMNRNKNLNISEPAQPSLYYIGSLDWVPNQEGILWFLNNVWPHIHKKLPYLKFHIAGRNAPKRLIKKLNKKNILFYGEVEDSSIFMKDKLIMIVPLFSGSGIRIKILEAMSIGKIIISTPIGAQGISCSKDKNIIIADSKDTFINEIEDLLTNENRLNSIKSNAINFIQNNYDNATLTKKLNDFYKEQLI